MKRLVVGALPVLLLALGLLGACDDAPRHYPGGGGGGTAHGSPHCGQYASCGTCTPALGCGWCATGATTGGPGGLCVDDPGDCPAATTVGWTWEPVGCHAGTSDAAVLADARVGTHADAGDAADAGSTQTFDATSDVY